MAPSVSNLGALGHLQRLEGLRPFMAKGLHEMENPRLPVGAALRRAIGIVGLSDKEAADLVGVDKSQFSRWLRGEESIQLHRIYATKLHGPFAIEMARDAAGVVIETTVTYSAVPR